MRGCKLSLQLHEFRCSNQVDADQIDAKLRTRVGKTQNRLHTVCRHGSVTQSNMDTDYFGQSSADFQGLADAIFIVEEQQLPVHTGILAANSATFAQMFRSCSDTTKPCPVVPLDDSLHDVTTTLELLYEGCSAIKASKLKSVEDAYCVTNFAHKYDMKGLLEECEAYLVTQARSSSKMLGPSGATVRWTLIAEKCEMSTLLAECELSMARRFDDSFWSNPAEDVMQLSTKSLLRMLRAAACCRNGRHTDVAQLVRWQQADASNLSEGFAPGPAKSWAKLLQASRSENRVHN